MSPVRPAPLTHRLQVAGHVLWVGGGWLVFGWMWWLVILQSRKADDFWWLLLVAFVVMPAMTVAWVLHNKGLYKRLGPRLSVRDVTEIYDADFHGREVQADWALMRESRFVRIDFTERLKVYQAQDMDGATTAGAGPAVGS